MNYIQGFVVPVPSDKKAAYRALAERIFPLFREYGALRLVEAWGDDVPDGQVTDFRRAVNATADETVVFAWIEWPDRQTYETASRRMAEDPRTRDMGEMPFDTRRMIFGGFAPLFEGP